MRASKMLGYWRIIEMEEWDNEFLEEEADAFIRFGADGTGEFHFCYLHGLMDCRLTERDGKPAAEWSWDGHDEDHAAFGRGWAALQEDGTLTGTIFFHEGEESGFKAKRGRHRKK